MIVFLLGGDMNTTINLFVRTVRGMIYLKSCIFEVLIARKFSETYSLGSCNWYLVLSMAAVDGFYLGVVPKVEWENQHHPSYGLVH